MVVSLTPEDGPGVPRGADDPWGRGARGKGRFPGECACADEDLRDAGGLAVAGLRRFCLQFCLDARIRGSSLPGLSSWRSCCSPVNPVTFLPQRPEQRGRGQLGAWRSGGLPWIPALYVPV
ncbi:hypothetical protein VULLAG_LOCUS8452 [Vulpes lagopus]